MEDSDLTGDSWTDFNNNCGNNQAGVCVRHSNAHYIDKMNKIVTFPLRVNFRVFSSFDCYRRGELSAIVEVLALYFLNVAFWLTCNIEI